MRQILGGMQYVHQQNIVHLDLKPENIVCVDTTGTLIKIIDFGLASKLGEISGFVSINPVYYPKLGIMLLCVFNTSCLHCK